MSSSRSRMIGGVSVDFPYKPYASQVQMMAKIIQGIKNRQNCLLESPTGSGKSLALLCAALAWQQAEYKKIQDELEAAANDVSAVIELCECSCHLPSMCCDSEVVKQSSCDDEVLKKASCLDKCPAVHPTESASSHEAGKVNSDTDDDTRSMCTNIKSEDADCDFKVQDKAFRTPGSRPPKKDSKKKRIHKGIQYEDDDKTSVLSTQVPTDFTMELNTTVASSTAAHLQSQLHKAESTSCPRCSCAAGKVMTGPRIQSVPKIFFGTRTHKQIAQICRELGKTAYRDTKMCILASREHTCIHPHISKLKNKNEECKTAVKFGSCSFYQNVKNISSQSQLEYHGLSTAWDMEDLVGVCKTIRACPYYGTRNLMDGADIIFCPYNYLIDPKISSQMGLHLQNQILVLDEAHNMEDTARESASFTFTQTQLEKACQDIRLMIDFNIKPKEHQAMWDMCSNIRTFLDLNSENVVMKSFNTSVKTWGGQDMLARLEHMGLGPDQYQVLMKAMCEIIPEHMEEKRHELNSATFSLFEGIGMMLSFIYKEGQIFLDSYRLAISKSMIQKPVETDGRWVRRGSRYEQQEEMSVNMWCLNPAVVFCELKNNVRTIILTSGTLSPMESFQSELDVQFPIQLEANHVIDNNQVWVGSLGSGPRGHRLEATYQIAETFNFQDDLGRLVQRVCYTVPHGVLCFLSSYRMLDKLADRWKTVGIWSEIEKRKRIICEPRGADRLDFDELLSDFYNVIEETESGATSYGVDGALFIAVCRGKVSEGMDFTDSNARAVITVGIPFPNFKDTQVELKREYNNKYSALRGILTGSEWYEIQAYRAINQALGRCIRHRNDWGALIMVDERFLRNPHKYIKGLSKWVRNKVTSYHNFNEAQDSLLCFVQERKEADKLGIRKSSSNESVLKSPFRPASTQNGMSQSKFYSPYENLMPRKVKLAQRTPTRSIIDLTDSPISSSTPVALGQSSLNMRKQLSTKTQVNPTTSSSEGNANLASKLLARVVEQGLKAQGVCNETPSKPYLPTSSNTVDNGLVEVPGRSIIQSDLKADKTVLPAPTVVSKPMGNDVVYVPYSTKPVAEHLSDLIKSGQLSLPKKKTINIVMLQNNNNTNIKTSNTVDTNVTNIDKVNISENSAKSDDLVKREVESTNQSLPDTSLVPQEVKDQSYSPPLFDLEVDEVEAMNNISSSSKELDNAEQEDAELGECEEDRIETRRTTNRKRIRNRGTVYGRKRRKTNNKQNVKEISHGQTCKCGSELFAYKDCENIKETPSFLQQFNNDNKRPIYISRSNDMTGLEAISSTLESGVTLNTCWCKGCGVMYLKCASCATNDVVGATVVAISPTMKEYTVDQIYLLGTTT